MPCVPPPTTGRPSTRLGKRDAVGSAPTLNPARLKAVAPLSLAPTDLAMFFLNVGDGDSIVIRFPEEAGVPSFGVIDSYRGAKTVALIRDLSPPAPAAPRIRFVCATHPHLDHISGLRNVLKTFAGRVEEFWDSGFRFTGTTYRNLIEEVEKQGLQHRLRLLRPTSGFEFFHAGAALSILSPSIALRNRYDTYGVDINNASIVVRLTYPVGKPSLQYPETDGPPPAGDAAPNSSTVILGGDAQSDAGARRKRSRAFQDQRSQDELLEEAPGHLLNQIPLAVHRACVVRVWPRPRRRPSGWPAAS